MTRQLSIYYDFASPFCYAAYAIVQRLRQQGGLTIVWLPFEVIDYLPPRGAMPQNPAFVRRGETARALALAQEYGLTMHLHDRLLNSNLALCAVEAVRDLQGPDASERRSEHLLGALFHAYYAEQRDISDLVTVLDVAEHLGMAAALEPALRQDTYPERVAQSRQTAQDLGVVAVPTWLAGGYGVVGVPAFAEIERLLTTASGEAPA